MITNNIDAPLSWDEADRLRALDSYAILDTAPEQAFDDVVQLVSQLFEAPIVAVNLIAESRQWFKSEIGLGMREMPLDDSICKVAILQHESMVVPDTLDDPRFACNALVTGAPGLRFYAGALLKTPEGLPLGTLCVLDLKPRPAGVTDLQLFALNMLAQRVMSELQLRKVVVQQQALLAEKTLAQAAQQAVEAELTASRERFQQIVRQAATGVVQCDGDGRLIMVNRKFCDMLGFTEAELIGKSVLDVTAPDSLAPTRAVLGELSDGNQDVVIEKRYLRKDGTLLWAKTNVNALRNASGQFQGMVAIVVDINASKLAEEQLRASEELLSEADRRKTEFLATLAHELRNPLAPIRSGLGVMRMGADNPAVMAKVRDMMDRQVTHMVRLIDDLLDIARISGGKLELKRAPVELNTVLVSAVETSLPLIEAGQHALNLTVSDEPLPANVDATRIGQVIANLLNNAAKYTPAGGCIRLSARRDGDDALICVSDNGVGIPDESLATVFEMFSQVGRTLDRAQGGLGIGLSLVRRLVQMHGGSVSAHSAGAGKGATFTVRLPLLPSPALPAAAPVRAAAPAAAQGAGLKILIADDNVDAADTLATIVELIGHTTRIANDGVQALAAARDFGPDAAFLDIGMPGMNGYQAAQAIRGTPGLELVTLIALTGWGAENDHALAKQAGFDFHLTKPVEFDVLSSLLAGLPAHPQAAPHLSLVAGQASP